MGAARAWYVLKEGRADGPFLAEEMRAMAAAGRMAANDQVCEAGTTAWVACAALGGAWSAPANDNGAGRQASGEAPRLPPTSDDARWSSAAVAAGANDLVVKAPPPLWNPDAGGCWSILFTPVFGAYLVTKNWEALGELERAKRSRLWFRAMVALIGVSMVAAYLDFTLPQKTAMPLLAAWYWLDQRPQAQYFRERFGSQYPRRSMTMAVGYALGGVALALVLAVLVAWGLDGESSSSETASGVTVTSPEVADHGPPMERGVPVEREALSRRIKGLSRAEVMRILGRPVRTSQSGIMDVWSYEGIVFDSVTGTIDAHTSVGFVDGAVYVFQSF